MSKVQKQLEREGKKQITLALKAIGLNIKNMIGKRGKNG